MLPYVANAMQSVLSSAGAIFSRRRGWADRYNGSGQPGVDGHLISHVGNMRFSKDRCIRIDVVTSPNGSIGTKTLI